MSYNLYHLNIPINLYKSVDIHKYRISVLMTLHQHPRDSQQSTPPKQCNFSKHAPAPSSHVTVSGCAVHFQDVFNMQEHRCNSSPPIKAFLEQSTGKTCKNKKTATQNVNAPNESLLEENVREINKGQWLLPLASHYIFYKIPSAQWEINASGI